MELAVGIDKDQHKSYGARVEGEALQTLKQLRL
eukprot:CAMPEP_0185493428 /NCGR_PEP_ID=MMETSP1366-20130426/16142_1 /TAXON_ID=38817 /ORGANISM="Gephyrocapsa oceanica, Strain RCC1303" /LENGTH=32 /DNA_ID= /DNA_START= /DNA_END= /DNA_ORIENTATION=